MVGELTAGVETQAAVPCWPSKEADNFNKVAACWEAAESKWGPLTVNTLDKIVSDAGEAFLAVINKLKAWGRSNCSLAKCLTRRRKATESSVDVQAS